MATKDTNYLVAVHKGLDESLEKQVAALPEKFNKQRFLQNGYISVRSTSEEDKFRYFKVRRDIEWFYDKLFPKE